MKHINFTVLFGYFLAIFALLALYIVLGILAFWELYPYKPFTITTQEATQPVPILNTTLHPGDQLEYNLSYCKYTDNTSIVHKHLVDGQSIPLDDSTGILIRGCGTIKNSTTVIPETVNPGTYYLFVDVEYRVNPIRTYNVHYRTQSFTVVAKPTPATAIIDGMPVNILIQPSATTTNQ
jgi:hypothetical protein